MSIRLEKIPTLLALKGKINDQITCRIRKSRDKYFETKHNVGFMLIDQLAKKQNVTFTHDKIFQADLASFFLNGEKFILSNQRHL